MENNSTKFELSPKISDDVNGKDKQDVVILVDGSSSVSGDDFKKMKQICKALSVRFGETSQLALVQFASKAKEECLLTLDKKEFDTRVEAMAQLGGGTELLAGLTNAKNLFSMSTKPTNMKQVWIITDGDYASQNQTVILAQEIKRSNARIVGIGVGGNVNEDKLKQVTSWGAAHLVKNFEEALKIVENTEIGVKETNLEVRLSIVLPKELYYKIGEDVQFEIEVENTGIKKIEQGSRVLIKQNTYFTAKSVIFTKDVASGTTDRFLSALRPHIRGNRSNLNQQLQNLPNMLQFEVLDPKGNRIHTNTIGFFLKLGKTDCERSNVPEFFAGDVALYVPSQRNVQKVNILALGPAGAGKSTFVNSLISSISDNIQNVNISGGKAEGITSQLLRFELDNLVRNVNGLNFSIYDCPGVEVDNYQGEELPMILDGILPPDYDILTNKKVFYTHIAKQRAEGTPEEEKKRLISAVAFFVPATSSEDTIERLADLFSLVTITYKRKAVVVISHIDRVGGEEDRKAVIKSICDSFRIDEANIYTLQNYVNSKDKDFFIDKNVLNVILACLQACNDFQALAAATKIESKFPPHPNFNLSQLQTVSPRLTPKSVTPAPPVNRLSKPQENSEFELQEFIDLLPENQRDTIKQIFVAEEIFTRSILETLTAEHMKLMGLKMGHISAIQKALQAPKSGSLSADVMRLLAGLNPTLSEKVKAAILKSGHTTIKTLKTLSEQDWKGLGLTMSAVLVTVNALSNFHE